MKRMVPLYLLKHDFKIENDQSMVSFDFFCIGLMIAMIFDIPVTADIFLTTKTIRQCDEIKSILGRVSRHFKEMGI